MAYAVGSFLSLSAFLLRAFGSFSFGLIIWKCSESCVKLTFRVCFAPIGYRGVCIERRVIKFTARYSHRSGGKWNMLLHFWKVACTSSYVNLAEVGLAPSVFCLILCNKDSTGITYICMI